MEIRTEFVSQSPAVGDKNRESFIKRSLKRLRRSQPFNALATSSLRSIFKATHTKSELVIRHLHRLGDVSLELPNRRTLRMWSQADDWVSNQVFWRGWSGYEPETIPLFYRLAQQAQTTIDVGAYVGFYTLIAAHANPSGRVYSFEPMSDVFERLRRNVALNGLENVLCINSAVGDKDGEAEFFHMPSEMPCSSSLSYQFMSSVVDLKVSTVSVTTLDRFVLENRIERVDLVKIDTETTEPQVIRGMTRTLTRDNPDIVCEILGRGAESALEEMLLPLGYHFYHLTPDGPVLRTQLKSHPECLNYLFSTRRVEDAQRS